MQTVPSLWWVLIGVLLASWAITWHVRRIAVSHGMLDHPNERSSHSIPTPRGGGLAIVLSSVLGILLVSFSGQVDCNLAFALVLGGVVVAIAGALDDRGLVSVRIRFAMQAIAAICAVYALGGLPPLRFAGSAIELGSIGDMLAVIAIMWTLNLFNFMDGIDGIAASEAIFVLGAGALLGVRGGIGPAVPATALLFAAAALGFLLWNWPPAKIFMGDVGSGYLGYVIAILALAASRENGAMIFVWLILGGVFFVDSTVTLIRRVMRGEKPHVAHRSHAYQWLSRRWNSHRRVTLLVCCINLGWLLPCAWLCQHFARYSIAIVVVALSPLFLVASLVGAGRPESRD